MDINKIDPLRLWFYTCCITDNSTTEETMEIMGQIVLYFSLFWAQVLVYLTESQGQIKESKECIFKETCFP